MTSTHFGALHRHRRPHRHLDDLTPPTPAVGFVTRLAAWR